jgi:hypothetical protein
VWEKNIKTYEKNIYMYRREIKRKQYKDGRKLTATRRVELVMDDSQKEKDYYLEMSVRLRRVT